MTWYQVNQVEKEQAISGSQGTHISLQAGAEVLTLRGHLLQELRRAPIHGSPCPCTSQKLRLHLSC